MFSNIVYLAGPLGLDPVMLDLEDLYYILFLRDWEYIDLEFDKVISFLKV